VEYKQVGGRLVGANQIPCRAWLDGYTQAWDLLGTRRQVSELTRLADRTKAECPRVLSWLERNPVRALQLAADWDRLLATVRWIDEHQLAGLYVRQVDVPGVDTKFIEGHQRVLTQLLDLQLDPARINPAAPDFADRYGFRRKPEYVRFRRVGLHPRERGDIPGLRARRRRHRALRRRLRGQYPGETWLARHPGPHLLG
jgi:hypothetical protein